MVLWPTPLNLNSCCLMASSGSSRRCSKQHKPLSAWRVLRMTYVQGEQRSSIDLTGMEYKGGSWKEGLSQRICSTCGEHNG
jgi:hypothetical protein